MKRKKIPLANDDCIDILLHQSGHIMLSDFDLAKQSSDPSGLPMMVHSEQNGVSSQGYLGKWAID